MKRFTKPILAAGLLAALAMAPGLAGAHDDVFLRNEAGQKLAPTSTEPYSPKATCGECHDYETITQGYHFQQGFSEVADDFNPDKPFVKSPGMFGKW